MATTNVTSQVSTNAWTTSEDVKKREVFSKAELDEMSKMFRENRWRNERFRKEEIERNHQRMIRIAKAKKENHRSNVIASSITFILSVLVFGVISLMICGYLDSTPISNRTYWCLGAIVILTFNFITFGVWAYVSERIMLNEKENGGRKK